MCKKRVYNIVLNNFTNDSRVLKTSRTLSYFGYELTVIALHDKVLPFRERIFGFDIVRLPLMLKKLPKNTLFQIFKYIEFIIRCCFYCRKANIIHCNDLNSLPIGVVIKKVFFWRAVKVVYDCHEYQTETVGLTKFQKFLKIKLEKLLINYADAVITVSPSIANEYKKLYSNVEPYLVLNCPLFTETLARKDKFRDRFPILVKQKIFLYQGFLGKGRGLDILMDSFEKIDGGGAVLVIMGYGPMQELIESKASSCNRIFFHPAVSPTVLLEYTASADFGISFIEDTCLNYRYCLPNKMFEYIMADVPVIVSDLEDMKSVIKKHQVGVVASENSVKGFCEAVKEALNLDMKQVRFNLLNTKQTYCWENQEKVLREIYFNVSR